MSKLNLTPQRKVIYELLTQSEDHPTAAEVIERLRLNGHHLAYGTVYNSLRYLSDMGLIRELKLGETASRYDARMEDHHHIVCRQCGRVDEVLSRTPSDWGQAVEQETGYRVDHSHVVFEGVCAECRSRTN
jgi:Fur family transcriptional regulator, peroxide stress response regulator